MPDLMQQRAAFVSAQAHANMASPVIYRRGSAMIRLDAGRGRSQMTEIAADGATIQHESRDFFVRASDLVFGVSQALPELGDTIIDLVSIPERKFEVLSIAGSPHFTRDSHGLTFRIHTKEIAR